MEIFRVYPPSAPDMKRVFRFSLKTLFLCHKTRRNSGHPKPVFLSTRLFLGKIWYKEG